MAVESSSLNILKKRLTKRESPVDSATPAEQAIGLFSSESRNWICWSRDHGSRFKRVNNAERKLNDMQKSTLSVVLILVHSGVAIAQIRRRNLETRKDETN